MQACISAVRSRSRLAQSLCEQTRCLVTPGVIHFDLSNSFNKTLPSPPVLLWAKLIFGIILTNLITRLTEQSSFSGQH